MREINLFQSHLKMIGAEEKTARQAMFLALFLLVIYCLVAAGIFSYWLIIKRQNEAVSRQTEHQESRIKELALLESRYLFIKQRLAALSPLLGKKIVDYRETLTLLEASIPEGVILVGVNLDEEGKLEISGEANNALAFAHLLDSLSAPEKDNLAKDISLSSASRQEDGSYKFSFIFNAEI